MLGDLDGANAWLRSQPYVTNKVGIFGTCSGGRHAFLAGCRLKGLDGVIDCWGGRVVMSKEELTPAQPVAPRVEVVSLYVPEKTKQTQMLTGSAAEAAAALVQKLRDEARVIA